MIFDFRVSGIPCQIRIRNLHVQPPCPGTFDSDLDYHGWIEYDFDVLDRGGRPAKWLDAKLTEQDLQAIYDYVEKHHDDDQE